MMLQYVPRTLNVGGYNVLLNVGYNGLSWYLDNTATDWAHVSYPLGSNCRWPTLVSMR